MAELVRHSSNSKTMRTTVQHTTPPRSVRHCYQWAWGTYRRPRHVQQHGWQCWYVQRFK